LSPYAAPGRRSDLAGLPPAFIAVGAIDLFAEEDIAYAMGLLRAGVPTELHVFPGAFHGFDSSPAAWAATAYLGLYGDALRRAFDRAAPAADASRSVEMTADR
jgi:triacylglycerol lipase